MLPFEVPVLGELWLALTLDSLFVKLMYDETVADPSAASPAYRRQLLHGDRGRAFLKIMRSWETTLDKQRLYEAVVQSPQAKESVRQWKPASPKEPDVGR